MPAPVAAKPLLISVVLLVLLGLSWFGSLDASARAQTETALEDTLISYAIARTLNGVISVAQGTEIAVQPAGIGVVLSAGEILDPLNDLIERFSWIVLLAASSLALQLVIGEILMTPILGIITSAAALLSIALLVSSSARFADARAVALRVTVTLLFLRFAIVAAGFATGLISDAYLDEREQASIQFLSETRTEIERRDDRSDQSESSSVLDQLDSFIEAQKETLNIDRRIDRLQRQVEAAVNEVINLIVVYLLKSLLIPLAMLGLLYGGLKFCLRQISR